MTHFPESPYIPPPLSFDERKPSRSRLGEYSHKPVTDSSAPLPDDPRVTGSTALVVYNPEVKETVEAKKIERVFAEHAYGTAPIKPGDVIVLAGTSTAGKSSVVNALKKIDPDIVEEDLDLRTSDTQTIPSPSAQREMMDDVIKHSLLGKRVVVHVDQAHKFLDHILERGVALPVKTVLVFCPFHELSRRLAERNRKAEEPGGNPQNLRDPLMPIDAFGNLYTQKKEPGKGLETITRERAVAIYIDHFDKMIAYARKLGRALPPDDVIAHDKIDSLNDFLLKLGFKEGVDSIEVEPRNKEHYNFIFDSHKYSDAEGSAAMARMLYDTLKKPAD